MMLEQAFKFIPVWLACTGNKRKSCDSCLFQSLWAVEGFLFAEKSADWLLSKVNRCLLSLRLACVVFHLKGGEGGLDERPE